MYSSRSVVGERENVGVPTQTIFRMYKIVLLPRFFGRTFKIPCAFREDQEVFDLLLSISAISTVGAEAVVITDSKISAVLEPW
jgi:hypothetical protein